MYFMSATLCFPYTKWPGHKLAWNEEWKKNMGFHIPKMAFVVFYHIISVSKNLTFPKSVEPKFKTKDERISCMYVPKDFI